MSKRKGFEPLVRNSKRPNISTDCIFFHTISKDKKIHQVAAMKIGKKPIYRSFVDYNNQYYPVRCIPNLGFTSFVISSEATIAFQIPVTQWEQKIQTKHDTGREITTKRPFTVPLGVSFGNHQSYIEEDHVHKVVKTS
jgi:hypothetical protein